MSKRQRGDVAAAEADADAVRVIVAAETARAYADAASAGGASSPWRSASSSCSGAPCVQHLRLFAQAKAYTMASSALRPPSCMACHDMDMPFQEKPDSGFDGFEQYNSISKSNYFEENKD